MTNKKIALFVPSLGGGGAERVMILLANELSFSGYSVDLVVANSQGGHKHALSSTVNLIDLSKPRVLFALPELVKYLRRVKPNVMISALDYANVVGIIAKKISLVSTKIIITEHSNFSVASHQDYKGVARLLPFLMKTTYRWADKILAVSSGVADDLAIQLKLNRTDIGIAYNPVISKDLDILSAEPVEWPWPRENNVPIVLSVGRLTKAKDYSTLISAFSILRKKKKIKLAILGEGELRSDLTDQIELAGVAADVELLGFVKNPYAWMSNADLFVMSSRWEGLPTSLIEAMGCGTRVISTDCPSGPAEILENGRWGKLVSVGDAVGLANAMHEELFGEIEIIEVKKRASDFSVEKSIKFYIDSIEDLI